MGSERPNLGPTFSPTFVSCTCWPKLGLLRRWSTFVEPTFVGTQFSPNKCCAVCCVVSANGQNLLVRLFSTFLTTFVHIVGTTFVGQQQMLSRLRRNISNNYFPSTENFFTNICWLLDTEEVMSKKPTNVNQSSNAQHLLAATFVGSFTLGCSILFAFIWHVAYSTLVNASLLFPLTFMCYAIFIRDGVVYHPLVQVSTRPGNYAGCYSGLNTFKREKNILKY